MILIVTRAVVGLKLSDNTNTAGKRVLVGIESQGAGPLGRLRNAVSFFFKSQKTAAGGK